MPTANGQNLNLRLGGFNQPRIVSSFASGGIIEALLAMSDPVEFERPVRARGMNLDMRLSDPVIISGNPHAAPQYLELSQGMTGIQEPVDLDPMFIDLALGHVQGQVTSYQATGQTLQVSQGQTEPFSEEWVSFWDSKANVEFGSGLLAASEIIIAAFPIAFATLQQGQGVSKRSDSIVICFTSPTQRVDDFDLSYVATGFPLSGDANVIRDTWYFGIGLTDSDSIR